MSVLLFLGALAFLAFGILLGMAGVTGPAAVIVGLSAFIVPVAFIAMFIPDSWFSGSP